MRLGIARAASVAAATAGLLAGYVGADDAPLFRSWAYDHSLLGKYPMQTFRSTSVTAPLYNVFASSDECDRSRYTLMTPRGKEVPRPQVTIMDPDGHLVWTMGLDGKQLYNLMVQEWKGEQYLTFWAGNDAVGGHGAGQYHLLDKHYRFAKTVDAAGGLAADLHDMRITKDGTAIMTMYEEMADQALDQPAANGQARAAVWDSIFQEVDLDSGELLFQWRALDHVRVADTLRREPAVPSGEEAYDFFHINSVDRDPRGNYLVSARFFALLYVDGRSGDVIWALGGTNNTFRDLSDGRAISMRFQHDARWASALEEEGGSSDGVVGDADAQGRRILTVFDNGIADGDKNDGARTRGLRLRIDEREMTVEVLAEYLHPHGAHAVSQGSMQTLPMPMPVPVAGTAADGKGNNQTEDNDDDDESSKSSSSKSSNRYNVLLGYGNGAGFTEHAANGTVLCHVAFQPEPQFGKGEVQSYRVLKYEWHGWPLTRPEAAIFSYVPPKADKKGGGGGGGGAGGNNKGQQRQRPNKQKPGQSSLFVSWNGATEVVEWVLEGSRKPDVEGKWTRVAATKKAGFETEIVLRPGYPRYVRAVAMDKDGQVLGMTNELATNRAQIWVKSPPSLLELYTPRPVTALVCVFFIVSVGYGVWKAARALVSWYAGRRLGAYRPIRSAV